MRQNGAKWAQNEVYCYFLKILFIIIFLTWHKFKVPQYLQLGTNVVSANSGYHGNQGQNVSKRPKMQFFPILVWEAISRNKVSCAGAC